MNYFKTIVVALAVGTNVAALAHDDATLDKMAAPNGGQLRMAGPYHYELVVVKDSKTNKENPIYVYVTDHGGAPIDTKGAAGTITLLSGKTKATGQLLPDGANRMKGSVAYASEPTLKALVSITLAGKTVEQARFVPLQPALSTDLPAFFGPSLSRKMAIRDWLLRVVV